MKTETNEKFNAVRESRKWKDAVWRDTAGMTSDERVAYFNAARERYVAQRAAWERTHAVALVR